MEHQGSSTDEEDCYDDDNTIAGPSNKNGKKNREKLQASEERKRTEHNAERIRQESNVFEKSKRSQPVVNTRQPEHDQNNKNGSSNSSIPRQKKDKKGKENNGPQESSSNYRPTEAVQQWLNDSLVNKRQTKDAQQRIIEAINSQDAALKYWRLVNLPFDVKWSSKTVHTAIPPPDMAALSSVVKSSLEKQRATHSSQKQSHFPTPEMIARAAEQKLHEDEDRRRKASFSSPREKVPQLDFGNSMHNHAKVRRRARIYGRSDFDNDNDCFEDEYEVVSPDPEYHHRQNRNIQLNGICSELRRSRKHSKNMQAESERLQKEKDRLDKECSEKMQRHMSISAPDFSNPPPPSAYFYPIRKAASLANPMSQAAPEIPKIPLNTGRFTAPPRSREISPHYTPREPVAGRRSPFFTTAANQRNQVSFNLPANGQQLLSTIKQNYPFLLGLAHQILQNQDKSKLVENFLHAIEKRADLMEQKLRRLEQNLKNSLGDRRSKLIVEMGTTSRHLKEYLNKIEELRLLHESPECQSNHHHGTRTQGHGTGQITTLNQIRLLQQIFEN